MIRRNLWIIFSVIFMISSVGLSAFAQERPKLTIAISPSAAPYTEDAIRRFESLYNVDVDMLHLASPRNEWLITRFLSGVKLDVVHTGPDDNAAMRRIGVAQDLVPFFEKDPDVSPDDWIPATLESFRGPAGEIYAVPKDVVLRAVMVNLDMVDQAGLRRPNEYSPLEWNWQRYREYGEQMVTVDGSGKLIVAGMSVGSQGVMNFWSQNGGYIVDHPALPTHSGLLKHETVSTVEEVASWFYPTPIATWSGSIEGLEVAMTVRTSAFPWQITDAGINWDIVNWPHGLAHNAQKASVTGYMMYNETDYPELAWELIKFLTTEQGHSLGLIKELARPSAYIPNANAIYNMDNMPAGSPPSSHLYFDMLVHPQLGTRPGFPGYDQFRSQFLQKLRREIFTGDRDVRVVLEELHAELDPVVANLYND